MSSHEKSIETLLVFLLQCKRGKKGSELGTLYGFFQEMGYTRPKEINVSVSALLPDVFLHRVDPKATSANIEISRMLSDLEKCLQPEQLKSLGYFLSLRIFMLHGQPFETFVLLAGHA
jgi:hypothetical protein